MNLKTYDYRDPGEIVARVATTHGLKDGDVLLVVVRDPSTSQDVEHVRRLSRRDWIGLGQTALADYLAEQVRGLPIPRRDGELRHSVLTVLVRRGFVVFGSYEERWLYAWRYSNHLVDTFWGDVVLVTEHGWRDFATSWGAQDPRLAA